MDAAQAFKRFSGVFVVFPGAAEIGSFPRREPLRKTVYVPAVQVRAAHERCKFEQGGYLRNERTQEHGSTASWHESLSTRTLEEAPKRPTANTCIGYFESYRRRARASSRGTDAVFVDRGALRAQAPRFAVPERRLVDRDEYTSFPPGVSFGIPF